MADLIEFENTNIWAFAQIPDDDARAKVFAAIKNGKSRFGCWGTVEDLRLEWDGKLAFLLRIKDGDWIVHVNMPHWGRCVAVRAIGSYAHDAGITCAWGADFVHYIPVDPSTFIEFDRHDPNVLPTVNLQPRARYQQVHAKKDFFASLENLRTNRVTLKDGEARELAHLREKVGPLLGDLTRLVHETHRGKNLERLFALVFRNMPNVVDVIENGFGWGTDYGADLIVTLQNSFGNLQLERKIVVQIKSYADSHYDLSCVEQVVNAIGQFGADAGMIVTTAETTEQLETEISKRAADLGKPIDLLAGKDVAQFIIENHPGLLFTAE